MRPERFCLCFLLNWQTGLVVIALSTILFGIISFAIYSTFIFLRHPSAIYLFIAFTPHAIVATTEFILAVLLGCLLLAGYCSHNPKAVLSFAWLVMVGYIVALAFLGVMLYEGQYVIDALVETYYKKEYFKEGDMPSQEHILCETIYYSYMVIHILLLVLLTTYVAVQTLTYYEQMVGLMEE